MKCPKCQTDVDGDEPRDFELEGAQLEHTPARCLEVVCKQRDEAKAELEAATDAAEERRERAKRAELAAEAFESLHAADMKLIREALSDAGVAQSGPQDGHTIADHVRELARERDDKAARLEAVERAWSEQHDVFTSENVALVTAIAAAREWREVVEKYGYHSEATRELEAVLGWREGKHTADSVAREATHRLAAAREREERAAAKLRVALPRVRDAMVREMIEEVCAALATPDAAGAGEERGT